jgi:hypothetical protein
MEDAEPRIHIYNSVLDRGDIFQLLPIDSQEERFRYPLDRLMVGLGTKLDTEINMKLNPDSMVHNQPLY